MTVPMPVPMIPALPGSTAGPDDAGYLSPEYRVLEQGWRFVRRIRQINESIRDDSATVLPKFDAEGLHNWETRCAMTFAFNALDETIHALVGLATRDAPTLEDDVPARLRTEWEDLDGQGTHGDVFMQRVLDHAVQDGHCAILVDYPAAAKGLTLAQEAALGLRAYAVLVPIERITAWRVGRVANVMRLMMVKLEESREVPVGTYGARVVKRFRTLTQEVGTDGTPFVTFDVQEESQDSSGRTIYVGVESGQLVGPEYIPLHGVYGGEQIGLLMSRPPLRGLAYSNLDHTQIKSDRRYSMHKCALAIPVFKGRTLPAAGAKGAAPAIVLSNDAGIDVSADGGAEYLEPKGTALQALRDELTDIERRMGSQGFSMLRQDAPATMTLGEKKMQSAREESKLARAVRSLQDAAELMLGDMAAFEGLPQGGSITMNHEFTDSYLSADDIRLLNELEDEGKLTLGTFLRQVQKCSPLLDGVDIEAELKLVEELRAAEPLTPEPPNTMIVPGLAPVPAPVPAA